MELFNNHIQVYWEKAIKNDLSWKEFVLIVKRNKDFLSTFEIAWLLDKSEKVNEVTCCEDCRVALLDSFYSLAIDCPSQTKLLVKGIKNINHQKAQEHLRKLRNFARVA